MLAEAVVVRVGGLVVSGETMQCTFYLRNLGNVRYLGNSHTRQNGAITAVYQKGRCIARACTSIFFCRRLFSAVLSSITVVLKSCDV